MPLSRNAWTKLRPELLVPAAVLVLVGFAVWQGVSAYLAKPTVSGDPFDLRLVGVRPDCSDEIRDGTGRIIAEEFYGLDRDPAWAPGQMRRDFIFDVGDTNAEVLASTSEIIYAAGQTYHRFERARRFRLPDGRQRVVAEVMFPGSIQRTLFLWRRQVPVRRVDLRLFFYLAEPGPVRRRFNGPFQTGQPSAWTNGWQLIPGTNSTEYKFGSAQFHLVSSNSIAGFPFPLIAIDTAGERHPVQRLRSSGKVARWDYDFRVDDVPLEEIAAIQHEEPREKTFHNLRVDYGDRPSRTFPEYREKVVAALQWKQDPAKLNTLRFRNPEEAIQVIDLVRGSGVRDVMRVLHLRAPSGGSSSLPAEVQARLRRTAAIWAQTLGVRTEGISLGLSCGWPEFVSPALDWLADSTSGGDSAITLKLLQAPGLLTTNDIWRLRDILLKAKPWTEVKRLAKCLQQSKNPVAGEVLFELAHDQHPWIWWPAVECLVGSVAGVPKPTPPSLAAAAVISGSKSDSRCLRWQDISDNRHPGQTSVPAGAGQFHARVAAS